MKKFSISILLAMFAAVFFIAGRAYAYDYGQNYGYFNNYYVGFSAGVAYTNPDGAPSSSGGTFNFTYGKDYRLSNYYNNSLNNNFVIGVGAILGYADNGNYTIGDFDGRGDNVEADIDSVYYGAFAKGGYALGNVMPFIKLGLIGYSFGANYTYSGPYGSRYETYSTPLTSEAGLLYGVGIKYMFNANWGATVQYLGAALSGGDEVDTLTVGADFNF